MSDEPGIIAIHVDPDGCIQRIDNNTGVKVTSVKYGDKLMTDLAYMAEKHYNGEHDGVCADCQFHPESVCGNDCSGCCTDDEFV